MKEWKEEGKERRRNGLVLGVENGEIGRRGEGRMERRGREVSEPSRILLSLVPPP